MFFSFDTIETDDKIIKHEAFIKSDDVNFSFACGEKKTFSICFVKSMFPIFYSKTTQWKKQKNCINFFPKTCGIKQICQQS